MSTRLLLSFVLLAACTAQIAGCKKGPPSGSPQQLSVRLQLNWLHDPTFAGEYLLSQDASMRITLVEGGMNISPVAEVLNGRAQIAVVGADIFLKSVNEDVEAGRLPRLACIFADLQRNPVGWVVHPDAARKAGLANLSVPGKERNAALFSELRKGTVKLGDKRGTETTSIWIQWAKKHDPQSQISVTPVGFDPGVVLSAPMLAYPVYLNEEPFKLSEKIGRPVAVFDPADDGICIYGNVVICMQTFVKSNPQAISAIQDGLRKAWKEVRDSQEKAIQAVMAVYQGVNRDVVAKQIARTTEFVYYQAAAAGEMDTSPGGKWETTLRALMASQVIGDKLTLDILKTCVVAPP